MSMMMCLMNNILQVMTTMSKMMVKMIVLVLTVILTMMLQGMSSKCEGSLGALMMCYAHNSTH